MRFHIYIPAVLKHPWEFIISCQWHYTEGILFHSYQTTVLQATKHTFYKPVSIIGIENKNWPMKSHYAIFAYPFRILNVPAVIHVCTHLFPGDPAIPADEDPGLYPIVQTLTHPAVGQDQPRGLRLWHYSRDVKFIFAVSLVKIQGTLLQETNITFIFTT